MVQAVEIIVQTGDVIVHAADVVVHAVNVTVHATESIADTFVVHAVEVVVIKVYMIDVAVGAVAIITKMLANKVAVIYGMTDGKMNMFADVIVGKTCTASKLNTGHFAKRTPGITTMGNSAKLAVGDGAGGGVGVISIIPGSSSAPPAPHLHGQAAQHVVQQAGFGSRRRDRRLWHGAGSGTGPAAAQWGVSPCLASAGSGSGRFRRPPCCAIISRLRASEGASGSLVWIVRWPSGDANFAAQ
jgi:hypothetical protein